MSVNLGTWLEALGKDFYISEDVCRCIHAYVVNPTDPPKSPFKKGLWLNGDRLLLGGHGHNSDTNTSWLREKGEREKDCKPGDFPFAPFPLPFNRKVLGLILPDYNRCHASITACSDLGRPDCSRSM